VNVAAVPRLRKLRQTEEDQVKRVCMIDFYTVNVSNDKSTINRLFKTGLKSERK